MTIKQLQKRIAQLQEHIENEVGSSTWELINELIELEIELEKECNK